MALRFYWRCSRRVRRRIFGRLNLSVSFRPSGIIDYQIVLFIRLNEAQFRARLRLDATVTRFQAMDIIAKTLIARLLLSVSGFLFGDLALKLGDLLAAALAKPELRLQVNQYQQEQQW